MDTVYDPTVSTTPTLDEYAKSHLEYAPSIMIKRINRFQPAPKRILDFGCGLGYMSLALARAYPGAEVLGVDIHSNFETLASFSADVLKEPLPPNLRFYQIEPGQSVSSLMMPDVIVSWSVMEHVSRRILPSVLADLHAALAAGGIAFTQICPLYFSPFGSHLQTVIDEPWHHLTYSHAELRNRIVPDASIPAIDENGPWRFAQYEELNKITAEELAQYLSEAGFDALEDTRLKMDLQPPAALLTAHPTEVLLNHELIFVHRKGISGQPGHRLKTQRRSLRGIAWSVARRLRRHLRNRFGRLIAPLASDAQLIGNPLRNRDRG